MNTQKMIDRRVSKGYNREESTEVLNELLATLSGVNLASALAYHAFITVAAAEKMQMAVNA